MPSIDIQSSERVFPASRSSDSGASKNEGITTKLSVSDASKANWGQAGGYWFFDAPSHAAVISSEQLKATLKATLDAYAPWTGQLRLHSYDPNDPKSQYGRLFIVHGNSSDPGSQFTVAKCSDTLTSLVPSPQDRTTTHGVWNAKEFDDLPWLPSDARVANPVGKDIENPDAADYSANDPIVVIQATYFGCGGLCVAVKISHSCSDAHGLVQFMKDWSSVSRATLSGTAIPKISPIYDSTRIDSTVLESTDDPHLNAEQHEKSKSLPSHRYDSFTNVPGQIPAELESNPAAKASAGEAMPWPDWDPTKPVSRYVVHYRPDHLTRLLEKANAGSTDISRHDALVAHVWSCINRARGMQDDDQPVHCDLMCNFRPRLDPPLPNSFMGAPFLIADVQASGSSVSSPANLAQSARAIRSTLQKFDARAISSQIHAWAHELTPQRIWQFFCGRRHIVWTSWHGSGLNDVDFGSGVGGLRFTRAIMPDVDGSIQLMEGAPVTTGASEGGGVGEKSKHWADDGVNVSIHVATETMDKLLEDPKLYAEV